MKRSHSLALGFILLSMSAFAADTPTREDARLITATVVLEELQSLPEQRIPGWLMERAYGVAVIPEVIKAAMVFGGRHGRGVMTVRDTAGRFSDPVFLSLSGGSVGFQVGAEATDVVLVFATRRSVEDFKNGKFALGASASVAAGPLGRSGEAAAGKDAEIYSYSRSRGLFAGVALDGIVLRVEKRANRSFYGREVSADEIISGGAKTSSAAASRFIAAVMKSLPATTAASTAAAPAPAAPAVGPAAPAASTAPTAAPADKPPASEAR